MAGYVEDLGGANLTEQIEHGAGTTLARGVEEDGGGVRLETVE